MKFKTYLTASSYEGEFNSGEILTVEGQGFTVKELWQGYVRGDETIETKPVFMGSDLDSCPDPDKYNLGYDVDQFDAIDDLRSGKYKQNDDGSVSPAEGD